MSGAGETTITRCPACGKRNRLPRTGRPACGNCGAALPWVMDAGDGDFDRAVASSGLVLVDLWAPWCGPCRMVAPVLEQIAGERAGRVKVVKVNVDESPGISARYDVRSIPTMLLFHRGRLVDQQVGALPHHAITAWLDRHADPAPG